MSGDPDEHHDAVVVVLSENWRNSRVIAREIVRARRQELPHRT